MRDPIRATETMTVWRAGGIAAPRRIGWIEANLMRRFGHTYEQAREIAQQKRRRAGRLRRHKPSPRIRR